MAILSGKFGDVLYAPPPTPATPVSVISLNTWKASFAIDYEDVTCFNDTNKVYVPGQMDISGSVAGFWNSEELALFLAATAQEPGLLKLVPNKNEPLFYWSGLAYLDASIDCTLSAPKVSGNFKAAGSWTGPEQAAADAAAAAKRAA